MKRNRQLPVSHNEPQNSFSGALTVIFRLCVFLRKKALKPLVSRLLFYAFWSMQLLCETQQARPQFSASSRGLRLPRKVISGFLMLTVVFASTEEVKKALPPMTTLSPISVAPPSSVDPA